MSKDTLKELRAKAEDAIKNGIRNKDQLLAAVPDMVELQKAVAGARKRLSETTEVLNECMRLCSEYAHAHPEHVFSESFSVSPIGVESGDVVIDGRNYHYAYGYDGYQRIDKTQRLTQDFLASLPDGWAKSKLELDATAIKNDKPTSDDLEAAGLERKPKLAWCEF